MSWRRIIEKLAGSTESPRRTAAAFAFGVFLSFSPFLGLQILAAIAAAFLLRLNRLAVFIGLCMNLPWVIVPWYTAMTFVGSLLLNQPIAEDVGARFEALMEMSFWTMQFWRAARDFVAPFFWSFLVGSTVGAALLGIAAYFATAPVLTRWRLSRDAQ